MPARLSFHDHHPRTPIAADRSHYLGGVVRRDYRRELGTDVFHRHFHQCGGNFRLLFNVPGQPLGRENRFSERRRIEAHFRGPYFVFQTSDMADLPMRALLLHRNRIYCKAPKINIERPHGDI
jgi:hypothetical protein